MAIFRITFEGTNYTTSRGGRNIVKRRKNIHAPLPAQQGAPTRDGCISPDMQHIKASLSPRRFSASDFVFDSIFIVLHVRAEVLMVAYRRRNQPWHTALVCTQVRVCFSLSVFFLLIPEVARKQCGPLLDWNFRRAIINVRQLMDFCVIIVRDERGSSYTYFMSANCSMKIMKIVSRLLMLLFCSSIISFTSTLIYVIDIEYIRFFL